MWGGEEEDVSQFAPWLKGQSHEIFCIRFFPQTNPLGPIRDVLGPF